MAGFELSMQAQRDRARAASRFQIENGDKVDLDIATDFTGYQELRSEARIVALFKGGESVRSLDATQKGTIVLDKTPFYAESGGQVGDVGVIYASNSKFEVLDTQKQGESCYLHHGQVEYGRLLIGDLGTAEVDAVKRQATALNHSATHLLHAALRGILGKHVTQKGSLVDASHLRFDFSHFEQIEVGDLQKIERRVNEQIRANSLVKADIMSKDDAMNVGAMALFGEKYGAEVRVLKIGDFSTELCGGTHVDRAGDIGFFKIVGETGVAAGVRRIEAITGGCAVDWAENSEAVLVKISAKH